MKSLTNVLMKGLVAVLPLGLTIYVIWWLAAGFESLLGDAIKVVLPERWYYPGMGILAGILLLFAVGSAVNAYVVRRWLGFWEDQFQRIPVVKTIYSSIRDVTRLLPSGGRRRDLQSVVIWRAGDARILGFVTRDDLPEIESREPGVDLVAVYFPMSYMIGGYTIFLPKASLEFLDMPVEAAMRLVLTGGVATTPGAVGGGPASAGAPGTRSATTSG